MDATINFALLSCSNVSGSPDFFGLIQILLFETVSNRTAMQSRNDGIHTRTFVYLSSISTLELRAWRNLSRKAVTTFHYHREVKSSFKLVWMESPSPCNSLVGTRWSGAAAHWSDQNLVDNTRIWPPQNRRPRFLHEYEYMGDKLDGMRKEMLCSCLLS